MAERGNGGIIGPVNQPTATVASGLWTLEEQTLAQKQARWPNASQIARSLRFNSADSAYLNRTPASASNRKTWTWSAWVKLGQLNLNQYGLFSARSGVDSTRFTSGLSSANTFLVSDISSSNVTLMSFETTQVFRDPSAWYHFLIAVDTTQATNTNRFKLYVNGVQVTSFSSSTYPSQNADTGINATIEHNIGKYALTGNVVDGYMTEVNFIDGQALTPSSFGYTDPDTGVWRPRQYGGTYGTNGFYLNFSDNSNTTAATLGKDYSGNGNNWTPNNFSVSAGAGNDSLVDVPTPWGVDTGVGGSVRGNYCTWNPLYGSPAPTNGNLDVTVGNQTVYGSMSFTSGKWYWEVTPTVASGDLYIGVMNSTYIRTDSGWATGPNRSYKNNGTTYGDGGGTYGASYTANDIIGIALDMDTGSITFYKNGVSQGTAFTNLGGSEWRPMVYASGTSTFVANFGQRPFAYTAPSGFKALCTQNLPTPTIGATAATQAGKYFNTVLYTGNSTNPRAISGFGFSPDYIVQARRDVGYGLQYFDIVRGAGKRLNSSSIAAEDTYNIVGSFDSDGFTITGGVDQGNNASGGSYVAWGWDAGGAGVTNTAGSITSTVSANTTSGFSVVTYTGTGATPTVGHGLGAVPKMIIVKVRNDTNPWNVYHVSTGATNRLLLNDTSASATSGVWNNTTPTSSVFSLGAANQVNQAGLNFVAYCFAEVPGFSKFGSYTSNNSADGPFLYCGFRPAYVMIKNTTDPNASWIVYDNKRNTANVETNWLLPNASNAEGTDASLVMDFTSNGIKIRGNGLSINSASNSYIFAAFAEFPQKFSLAR